MKRKRMSEDRRAEREQAIARNKRLLALAEKAQADLDRRKQQRESA
jgi:hypothetical protein